jgi:hypothetical protein
MNPWESLLGDGLQQPVTAIAYEVSRRLAAQFPDKALIEGDSCSFDLRQFVEGGHCTLRDKGQGVHNQIATGWYGEEYGLWRTFENVWFEVAWEGHTLDILLMGWPQGYSAANRYWILADVKEVAERFYEAVCVWGAEVRGEVLVFENGGWHKSRDLFEAIQGSSFDNLILKGALKQEIAEDVARFFASRDQYERYGVPWTRANTRRIRITCARSFSAPGRRRPASSLWKTLTR